MSVSQGSKATNFSSDRDIDSPLDLLSALMLHGSAFIMKTAAMAVNKISSPQTCETFMAGDVGNNAR